ncbi:MAG: PAS domain S-box protein [Spirochaetaceae bacterium]
MRKTNSNQSGQNKHIKKQLNLTNNDMEGFFNIIPSMLAIASDDGYLKKINSEWTRILGFSEEELLSKPLFDFIHPEDIAPTLKEIGRQQAGFSTINFINRYRCKDGSYRFIEWESTPASNGFLYASGRDITESKKVEEDIKRREEQYYALSENNPDNIMRYDKKLRHIYANQSTLHVSGFTEDEYIGKTHRELGYPEDLCEFWEGIIKRVFKTGENHSEIFEWQGVDKLMTLEWRCIPEFATDGSVESVLAISRDVTERKNVENQLIESENRFRRAVEKSPFPIMIHAEDGEVLSISNTWTELSGYTHDDIPTISIWTEKAYGIQKKMVTQDINALYDLQHRKSEGEYEVNCSDGSKKIWDFSSISLGRLPDNRRIAMSMAADVTDRIKAEVDKDKLQQQLNHKSKMDSIGELAGGMAHDFNNVLTGIMSASQLLSLPTSGLSENNLKYVGMISQASVRASELISKMLAFSRKGKIVTTTLNIHEILNDLVEILEGTIDKKITLSVVKEAPNYNFTGDLSAIESAFLNLGINASHAMPDGGTIQFKTFNTFLDQKYCDSSSFEIKPGNYLRIEIKDTGCGIPKVNLDKIFNPFYSTKEQGKGTGLGLSAVYGTIQDHDGSIEVNSEVGLGTTFNILLPCSEHLIKQVKDIKPILTGAGTILLVDDEELNRILNQEILELLGYKVLLAKDGLESIEIFSKKHSEIDIVLMDMIMPKMNGAEAFTKMRTIDGNCKVIITSGYIKDEKIDELIKLGLAGFISKPYKISEISQLLDIV